MAIVVTKKGRSKIAKWFQGIAPSPSNTFKVRLFTNLFTPTPSSVIGDFTEATFGGYAEFSCTYSETTGPTLVGNQAIVRLKGAGMAWACTSSPQTIYGWYIYDTVEADVILCEKYASAVLLTAPGSHTLYLDVSTGLWAND